MGWALLSLYSILERRGLIYAVFAEVRNIFAEHLFFFLKKCILQYDFCDGYASYLYKFTFVGWQKVVLEPWEARTGDLLVESNILIRIRCLQTRNLHETHFQMSGSHNIFISLYFTLTELYNVKCETNQSAGP
jgi:hypothetical protein